MGFGNVVVGCWPDVGVPVVEARICLADVEDDIVCMLARAIGG